MATTAAAGNGVVRIAASATSTAPSTRREPPSPGAVRAGRRAGRRARPLRRPDRPRPARGGAGPGQGCHRRGQGPDRRGARQPRLRVGQAGRGPADPRRRRASRCSTATREGRGDRLRGGQGVRRRLRPAHAGPLGRADHQALRPGGGRRGAEAGVGPGAAAAAAARRRAALRPDPGHRRGRAVEIFPFLGCSRLEEPLNRYPVAAVFHGHAHRGSPEGRTRGDIRSTTSRCRCCRRPTPTAPLPRHRSAARPPAGARPTRRACWRSRRRTLGSRRTAASVRVGPDPDQRRLRVRAAGAPLHSRGCSAGPLDDTPEVVVDPSGQPRSPSSSIRSPKGAPFSSTTRAAAAAPASSRHCSPALRSTRTSRDLEAVRRFLCFAASRSLAPPTTPPSPRPTRTWRSRSGSSGCCWSARSLRGGLGSGCRSCRGWRRSLSSAGRAVDRASCAAPGLDETNPERRLPRRLHPLPAAGADDGPAAVGRFPAGPASAPSPRAPAQPCRLLRALPPADAAPATSACSRRSSRRRCW